MRISSHRYQENNSTNSGGNQNNKEGAAVGKVYGDADFELDPMQGLIYLLQLQNDDKNDEISQDLMGGLHTLQEKRQELGCNHPEVASVLNYIGTLLFRRRELDYALCFFAQELRVEERLRSQQQVGQKSPSSSVGDDVSISISISVTCNNIGRILQELGRYHEAKYYYQQSLGNEGDGDSNNNTSTSNCNSSTIHGSSKSNNTSKTRQRNQKPVCKSVVNDVRGDNDHHDDNNYVSKENVLNKEGTKIRIQQ